MSTDTQSSAPDCPFPCGWQGLHKIAVQDAAYLAKVQWPEDEEGVSVPRATAIRCMDYLIQVCRTMLNAAPVAAQPEVMQQTLDDVIAGIPARDAEIAALRKQVETLQAQLVDRSPEMQGTPVDESPNLQGQQQPVSGADGLPIELRGVSETAAEGGGMWRSCSGCHELNEGHDTGPRSKVFGCALGNGCSECGGIGAIWDTTDYDAMGDALAASMAQPQPSGNSGEFEIFAGQKLMEAYKAGMHGKDYCMPRARELLSRAALAQQDADKVDAALAEMVHAMFRSGNSVPVTRITIDRKQYDAAIDAARKEQA